MSRFLALLLYLSLASPVVAQDLSEYASACIADNSIDCLTGLLTGKGAFQLVDSLKAYHNSERLAVDKLLMADMKLIEEISPALVLKGVILAMETTAPELMKDFRETQPIPSTSEETLHYFLALFQRYSEAGVDLSENEVPAYEEIDIQIHDTGIPKKDKP